MSGFSNANLGFSSDSGQSTSLYFGSSGIISGTELSGVTFGSSQLNANGAAGTWRLTSISLSDKANNYLYKSTSNSDWNTFLSSSGITQTSFDVVYGGDQITPVISLAVSSASAAEDGTTNLVYTFSRTGPSTTALTVNYTVGGNATLGTDYSGIAATPATKTVSFAAGSTTAIVTVDPTADVEIEPDETVALTLAAGSGYSIATTTAVVGTILNDDLPVITLAVAPTAGVSEDGTANLIYTFSRTGPTTSTLSVNYTVGGTATLGTDFSGIAATPATKTVSFAANSAIAIVTVDPTADAEIEPDETIALTLAAGTGYSIATTTAVVGTILNDDLPVITLAVAPTAGVSEDGTANLIYTFSRTGPTTSTLSVNYTVGGTATLGTDFSGIAATPATKTVSFAAGADTTTVTVDLTVDTTIEPDETVALTLTTGNGYSIGTADAVVGTVLNDDLPRHGVISLSDYHYTVYENEFAEITINRINGSDGVVSVALIMNDATATASDDYINTPIIVSFTNGETSKTVTIPIVNDAEFESDETIRLTLANPSGGSRLGEIDSAILSIIDNDTGIISFRQPTFTGKEDDFVTVRLARTGGINASAFVTLLISNGSATFPQDFSQNSINVVFVAGETEKDVTIPVINDSQYEANETISLSLRNPSLGSKIGALGTAGLTIISEDPPFPGIFTFDSAIYSINEDGSNVNPIKIVRSNGSDGQVIVFLTISDLSATAPNDYKNGPISVVFLDGETSKVVTFPVENDIIPELDEIATLALSIPTGGASLGAQNTASLTIFDNKITPILTLSTNKRIIDEALGNNAAVGTVTRNVITNHDLIVNLVSSDTSEATFPVQVVIPAGQASATFDINVIEDGIPDADQKVTLSATALGYPIASNQVIVTDLKMPDLVVLEFSNSSNLYTGTQSFFSYKVSNNGLFTADARLNPLVDRIYLSNNPILDGADQLLADVSINAKVLTGQYYQRNLPFFAPKTPGSYYLIAEIDANNVIDEGESGESNNIVVTPIKVEPAYRGIVSANVDVGSAGQSVVLHGEALSNEDDSPVAYEFVSIAIKHNGFIRELSALTDGNGDFTKTFKPLPGEAGSYEINAYFPGYSNEDNAPEDSLKLLGMNFSERSISPKILADQPYTGQATLQNLSDLPINGLAYSVEGAPSDWQIQVSLPSSLPGSGQAAISYTILAPNQSSVNQDDFTFRITSTEGVGASLPISATLQRLAPRLVASVEALTSGMLRGDQTTVECSVTNTGGAAAKDIKVEIPGLPWLKLASPATISNLGVGETTKISLLLSPNRQLDLGEYTGNLFLDSDGSDGDLSVPFKFRAISDAVANLRVNVENEFTRYAAGSPKLADATVILRDYFSSAEVRRAVTSSTGIVAWNEMPEGYYKLDVQAANHKSFSQNVKLEAGETETITSFLSRQAVRYVWNVVPSEIEDEYSITLTSVFEADVPQPVITVEPELIDMAYLKQIGNVNQIDLTFTNHGLVATDTPYMLVFPDTGKFPLTEFYKFSPLIKTIDRLEAKESLTVPVRITRVSECNDGDCSIIDVPFPILGVPFFGTFIPLEEPAIEYLNIEVPNGKDGEWPQFKIPPDAPDIPIVIRIPNSDATVKIQINQQALMTRTAFIGTLTIDNGNDFNLENIKVELQIKNAQGANATGLFGISQPALINLSAADGTGSLRADDPNTPQDEGVGSAEWTFIPTNTAAPDAPLQYAIGGTLSYVEAGKTFTVPLLSPPITVYPQAELYLDYFQSRNVYGDDPYTDLVEPSIPFSLAVLARNEGKGDAKNLRITSSQPKIIENKSGLLIDFNIIGSQVNGAEAEPSLTVDLGDIKAGGTAVGDWLLKSSLQGKFKEYEATFEHVNTLSKPELSLIKAVKIHELIQKVSADGDELPDFLVNDLPDSQVAPDTLYFSKGGTAPVQRATQVRSDGLVTLTDRSVEIKATLESGWSYFNLPDPGQGFFNINKITRADETEVPLSNFWRTDRTFPASLEFEGTEVVWDVNNLDNPITVQEYDDKPIYEFRLHLLDQQATAGEQTYTVTYSSGDLTPPKIRNMVYVKPVEPNGWLFPIPEELKKKDSIQLLFTEPIHRESFDLSDISVTVDGVPVDSSGLKITALNPDLPIAFSISNLEAVSQNVGQYQLNVNAAGIQDLEGNSGSGVVKEFWSVTGDRPFVDSVSGFGSTLVTKPITQTITVKFSEPIQPGSFTYEDLTITRNEGGNLSKNTITVTKVDENTYEVGNLVDITDVGGSYTFLVDAKGVVDLDSNRGVDAKGFTWTLDATPPEIVSLTGLSQYRRTKVAELDVKFTKAIDASSFDLRDLVFKANGVEMQLDSKVSVTRLTDVSYRLSGLSGLQTGDGEYSLMVRGSGIQDDWGRAGTAARVVNWGLDTIAPTKAANLEYSLRGPVLSIQGELAERDLRVYVVDRTDRRSLGELTVTGNRFSGEIQLPNTNNRSIAIQLFDGANNSTTSLLKIVDGSIQEFNPAPFDRSSLNPFYTYSFVAQSGDFPEDSALVDNTPSTNSQFRLREEVTNSGFSSLGAGLQLQSLSSQSLESMTVEPSIPTPVAIGFIKPEVSINDKGQIAFIGDGAAGGFTESWLGRSIKKDLILVSSEGLGMKNIAPNMIKSTFKHPAYAYLEDPSILTFLLNTDARNPTRYFDKFSDITISAGLAKRQFAGGVQINNNGEVLVRRIEQAEGPVLLMAYLLGNFVGPSFIASDYVNKPYSFIEKWDANTLDTVTPVGQGFVPMFLLNDISLALSGLTGMYGALSFAAAPILRTYWPDYYGLLSNPSFNNNGDTVFNAFLEGTWHPTASAGYYTALHSDGNTKPGAPTLFTQQQYDPALGAPRFWIADNGTVVRSYSQKIEILNRDLSVKTSIPEHFSNLGANPRISDDGTVIAFYGELSVEGAASYHSTPGEGIFVYRVSDGAIERIAGISGNGFLDQGEIWEDTNLNGQVDRGEDQGTFGRFDPESPVGVNVQKIGYTVAYIGFDNQDNKGLYSTNFGFSNDSSISVASASMSQARETQLFLPSLIVEQGAGITDVAIYDPVNTKGDIAFWIDTGDRDIAATANAVPSMEIDRWWATTGDTPIEANLYISVTQNTFYTLEIDFERLKWSLNNATITIDGGAQVPISSLLIGQPSGKASANLGFLSKGRHQLKFSGFDVPKQPVVEEIRFSLKGGDVEIDELLTKFVADHPEPSIDKSLIARFAPILHFDSKEKFDDPLDPVGYHWETLLKRQEPNQAKPVRLGDAETIVQLNPDALQSEPTTFATLLEQNGEIAISYYFHYAKSNWADHDGANTHDGDWEGITVFLKNGEPDRVAFNQHVEFGGFIGSTYTNEWDGGATYRWDYLDFDKYTGRPKVYVGLGGHASYPKQGQTNWFPSNLELHWGTGTRIAPNVQYLPRVGDGYIGDEIYAEDGKAQEWLLFPGKWGEQNKGKPFLGGGNNGPEGPVFQSLSQYPSKPGERWLDPWSFSDKFDIPLIAQDDSFNIQHKSKYVFNKHDFLANDNYDGAHDILVIPNPLGSALGGNLYREGNQIIYEAPDVDNNAEFVEDSFDYFLWDSTLTAEITEATAEIAGVFLVLQNPLTSLLDKITAYLTLAKILADPPAILSGFLGEEVDLLGTVDVTIERPQLSIEDIKIVEGFDDTAILTVTVDKPSPEQITVDFSTIPASATSELDYKTTAGTLLIPANTRSAEIFVPILIDELKEEDETFEIKLSQPRNAVLAKDQAVVTILDTKVTIGSITVVEGMANIASLNVLVNKPSPKEIRVDYFTIPSSASSDLDYSSQSGTLIIPANTSSATIDIPMLDDNTVEESETFSVHLSNPINTTLTKGQGTVTIIDADFVDVIPVETNNNKILNVTTPKSSPKFNIRSTSNPSPSDAPERTTFPIEFLDIDIPQITLGGNTAVTLFLPQDSPTNAYWHYGKTAANPTPHWYNFLYDPISKTGAVFKDLNGDGQNEIILHFVDGQRGDDDLAANGRISDPGAPAYSSNPPPPEPPVLAFAAGSIDFAEGNSGITAYSFSVIRNGDTSGASTATWTVSGSGTNSASAVDFDGGSFPTGTVLFEAGETSQTITVNVEGDKTVEPDETFTIALSVPTDAILEPSATTAAGTIRNDDQNQGPASFLITGTTGVGQKLTATRSDSDPDGDGEPAFNWQTFIAGTWTSAGSDATYTVAASDEGKQLRLQVSYTDGQGFNESITTPTLVVPLLPTVAINASTTAQQEGNIGSTPYSFSITRSGDLAGESRVSWSVEGSGANPATALDFAGGALPAGSALFGPGQDTLSLAISVVGDGTLEPDEGFRFQLHSPIGARLSTATSTGLLQILNDDQPAPTYSFVATPQIVYEGSTLHIAITTTNVEVGRSLWWQLSGTGITAADFSDGLLSGAALIGSDGRAAFTKGIAADAAVEQEETLAVRFFSDAARTQLLGSSIAVTIKEPSVGVVTEGNDVIIGTAAAEAVTGVPYGSAARGRGSLDRLTGGSGADIFLLGDAQGPYYDDGTSGLGSTDLALITDLTSDDRIQLHGASSAYRLVSGRHGGIPGVRIDALATAPGNTPEAIGFVQGATLASLTLTNPNQFLYV